MNLSSALPMNSLGLAESFNYLKRDLFVCLFFASTELVHFYSFDELFYSTYIYEK